MLEVEQQRETSKNYSQLEGIRGHHWESSEQHGTTSLHALPESSNSL